MKILGSKLIKVKNLLKELPTFLAVHAFLAFLAFFILALILAGIVFYRYNILIEKENPEVSYKESQFKEKSLNNIMEILEEREKKFNEADSKQYLNPFQVSVPSSSSPTSPTSPALPPSTPPVID